MLLCKVKLKYFYFPLELHQQKYMSDSMWARIHWMPIRMKHVANHRIWRKYLKYWKEHADLWSKKQHDILKELLWSPNRLVQSKSTYWLRKINLEKEMKFRLQVCILFICPHEGTLRQSLEYWYGYFIYVGFIIHMGRRGKSEMWISKNIQLMNIPDGR